MSLVKHTPRGMTPWFGLDRFLDDFDRSFGEQGAWAPAVDIYEDEKAITLKAELPDMDEKDIDVRVEEGHLTIKGERKFETEEKKENFHRIERRHGSFERTFALPDTVDAENISAKYDKGVLKVVAPKVERPKNARTIQVS
ncbi:MAG: Hsp20/alpha crystallin family protein [Acidobacteria bacterium]|nr:Hsp20/alpha crystallin family protein [Acidobacteriota bacterium]